VLPELRQSPINIPAKQGFSLKKWAAADYGLDFFGIRCKKKAFFETGGSVSASNAVKYQGTR
jgi:hypothetical protein